MLAFFTTGALVFSFTKNSSGCTVTDTIKTKDSARVKKQICNLVQTVYPEMKNIQIELGTFTSDTILFRSFFSFSRMYGRQNGYKIQYMKKALSTGITERALRAVLAQ